MSAPTEWVSGTRTDPAATSSRPATSSLRRPRASATRSQRQREQRDRDRVGGERDADLPRRRRRCAPGSPAPGGRPARAARSRSRPRRSRPRPPPRRPRGAVGLEALTDAASVNARKASIRRLRGCRLRPCSRWCRLLLAAVLAGASIAKLASPARAVPRWRRSGSTAPRAGAAWAAVIVAELALAAGDRRRIDLAAYLAAAMMATFAATAVGDAPWPRRSPVRLLRGPLDRRLARGGVATWCSSFAFSRAAVATDEGADDGRVAGAGARRRLARLRGAGDRRARARPRGRAAAAAAGPGQRRSRSPRRGRRSAREPD